MCVVSGVSLCQHSCLSARTCMYMCVCVCVCVFEMCGGAHLQACCLHLHIHVHAVIGRTCSSLHMLARVYTCISFVRVCARAPQVAGHIQMSVDISTSRTLQKGV